jgi:hypothetical protein
MKRIVLLVVLLAAALAARHYIGSGASQTFEAVTGLDVPQAFRSGESITGTGMVMRLLPDDDDGSRHQRFILRLPSGQTLLVAHNVDLAPRVDNLRVGDTLDFRGEFEPSPQGGVVHWTHHDPRGQHPAGWLRHQGHVYQ